MISDLEKRLCGMKEFDHYNIQIHNYRGWCLEYNNAPMDSNIAILVTCYREHLMFLKSTLRQYRLTGKFVIGSYDTNFNGYLKSWAKVHKKYIPDPDIWMLAHTWVFKHSTMDSLKRVGWMWDIIYGNAIVQAFDNIEYVFCVNGDCIWEKPEGVDEIIKILGDGDLMSASSNYTDANFGGGSIHTCSVIYRKEAFNKIIKFFMDKQKVPTIGCTSPEVTLREATKYLNLKEVKAPVQPLFPDHDTARAGGLDHHHCWQQPCTWKKVLGFRNLGAERVNHYKYKYGIGPPVEYTDPEWGSPPEKAEYKKFIENGGKMKLDYEE